jgi:hypothetical protein
MWWFKTGSLMALQFKLYNWFFRNIGVHNLIRYLIVETANVDGPEPEALLQKHLRLQVFAE